MSPAADRMLTASPLPMGIDELVARRISQRRRELRLSLATVARGCGVSLQQIHRYEIGANAISVTMLWRIAQVLRTDVAYFFEDVEPLRAASG